MGWMSGDRIPVGATFSAPVQTGPGAHPAYYLMSTGASLHGGNSSTVGPRFNGLIGGEGVSAIAESPLKGMYFKNIYQ